MKIGCQQCGTYEKHEPCPDCGETQHMGDDYRCPHGRAFQHKGFEAYYDIGLGIQVTDPGDRNKELRPKWERDNIVHLQPADRGSNYYKELSERREERRSRTLR